MNNAINMIVECWGEQGTAVVAICQQLNAAPMTTNEFLSHCTACGGNWGGMLLSGIRELYPAVYDAIPDNMGSKAWFCLASVLELLNITE
jgi:hypothetical protein